VQRKCILISRQLSLAIILLLFLCSAANAAITGFVTKDDDGAYYQFSYDQLLDSYALKILGRPDGLYQEYANKKEVYALLDSVRGYIDYNDVLDRYAEAVVLGEKFDLIGYTESNKAKKAEMPGTVKLVQLNEGSVVYSAKTISSNNPGPDPDFEPPKTKTPLIGAAGASLEQARQWAEDRHAHQRLIDIAPVYWSYGNKTGIRPEVLYAQAAIETNFGHFSSQVPPEYNNWAGILRADAEGDDPEDYQKFTDPEDGVRGHFNHLAAYVGFKPLGEPHERYEVIADQPWAGSIVYVDNLSGKWSPDENYHIYILSLLDQIKNTKTPDSAAEKEPEDDQPDPDQDIDLSDTKHVAVDVKEITVLHLRSGPSTDHDILDRLVRGTVLEVIGSKNEWWEVITPDDKKGWVHGDYVKPIDLSSNPLKDKIIAIDPGHGGSDSGAIGVTELKEKVVNLAVATHLEDLLKEAGAKVIMTRSGDQSVSNKKRVELANEGKADAFVSIHANAFSNPKSNGTETYYCSNKNNSDVDKYLAQQLQRELIAELGLRNRGVKSNSYYVLNNTQMPAALVELAFLSNAEEEELLRKKETHRRAADALFKGLEAHFRKYR